MRIRLLPVSIINKFGISPVNIGIFGRYIEEKCFYACIIIFASQYNNAGIFAGIEIISERNAVIQSSDINCSVQYVRRRR